MIVIKSMMETGARRPLDAAKKLESYKPWGTRTKDIEKEATKKNENNRGYVRNYLPEPKDGEKEKVWRIEVVETSPWSKIDCFGMTFEQETFFPRNELGVNPKQSVILNILTDSQMTALKARIKDKTKRHQNIATGQTEIYTIDELVEISEVTIDPEDMESNIVSQKKISSLEAKARNKARETETETTKEGGK